MLHVANNDLVFSCYICICCLKLHQADYHVEEFLIFCTFLWVGGGWGWGGGWGGGWGPMYLLFGAIY